MWRIEIYASIKEKENHESPIPNIMDRSHLDENHRQVMCIALVFEHFMS